MSEQVICNQCKKPVQVKRDKHANYVIECCGKRSISYSFPKTVQGWQAMQQ